MTIGLRYEKEIVRTMRARGADVHTELTLDRRNKIDLFVRGVGDTPFVHPVAVQVTLLVDGIDKMSRFLDMVRSRRVRNAVYIYVHIDERVAPETAADALLARIVAESRQMRTEAYGLKIDLEGCKAFSIPRRIAELEREEQRRSTKDREERDQRQKDRRR